MTMDEAVYHSIDDDDLRPSEHYVCSTSQGVPGAVVLHLSAGDISSLRICRSILYL